MTLLEALELITKSNDELYSVIGKVSEVDKNKRVCSVKPLENKEAIIFDVKLQAEESSDSGFVCFPSVDSLVIVTFINKQSAYVAMFSKVDSIEAKIGTQKMDFDKDGLLLESSQGSLLSAWTDLLGILEKFKMFTNMGATVGVVPDVIVEIKKLELKIKSFLK